MNFRDLELLRVLQVLGLVVLVDVVDFVVGFAHHLVVNLVAELVLHPVLNLTQCRNLVNN